MVNFNETPKKDSEFAEEYKIMQKDLKQVVIWNLVFIVILVVLYFINQQTSFLTKLEALF